MAVYEQAVDAVIDIKRNQANGQDDLFGMGDDSQPTQMGVERVVPDDDWDRSTKLAFEREMLGLYVSCLLYTSPSPRDRQKSRMPSSA